MSGLSSSTGRPASVASERTIPAPGPGMTGSHAIPPRPRTIRTASGVDHPESLRVEATRRAPLRRPVHGDDGDALRRCRAMDTARSSTDDAPYLDAGFDILN